MKRKPPKNPRIHTSRGYAIVTKRGRVAVDTICRTKEEVKFFMSEYNENKGDKIMRVSVVVTISHFPQGSETP